MKKASLIYNPVAGKKIFAGKLDNIIRDFQHHGWQVVPYRTTGTETRSMLAKILKQDNYDAVLVAGGDGTVHQVVNGILWGQVSAPLGIMPVGTANDFAAHINLPQDIEGCCETIFAGETTKVDVGLASGIYFLNAASAGLLTEIPHKTDVAMKNVLGKLAYYLKGIEEIPNFRPIEVEITHKAEVYRDEVLMFLVVNGTTAGGFNRLAPRASIIDGLFDVIIVKPCNLGQLFGIFLKLIKGEHINDPRVEYFQTDALTIRCTQDLGTDLDGEPGPPLPLEINVLPRKLAVFTPNRSP